MSENKRSRKWLLTINNPLDHGITDNYIKDSLLKYKSLVYYCFSHEIGGEKKVPHVHIYIHLKNASSFNAIKKRFNSAHIDLAKGTAQQNKDYVFKEGKYLHSEKGTTNLRDTHFEYGELPIERQGARNDLNDLYDMIKEGWSDKQILDENPSYMLQLDKIDKIRQTIKFEEYKNKIREVEVHYIYGKSGSGKTRFVMDKYGYSNVYRITDYLHPFDNYKGEEIIIFEEFRSSLKIRDMLNFLDIYPLQLPCRYNNKCACYTQIYIISNIALDKQYTEIQKNEYETWLAFLRRINDVSVYTMIKKETYTTYDYLHSPILSIDDTVNF